jgi:hypothetical protein
MTKHPNMTGPMPPAKFTNVSTPVPITVPTTVPRPIGGTSPVGVVEFQLMDDC